MLYGNRYVGQSQAWQLTGNQVLWGTDEDDMAYHNRLLLFSILVVLLRSCGPSIDEAKA